MLYPIYKSIKNKLIQDLLDLKDVQWFNDQYNSIIIAEPIAFIEFSDPVEISDISKQSDRGLCTMKLHLISKSISDTDNTISDEQIERQSNREDLAVVSLRNYVPSSGTAKLATPMKLTSIQTIHEYKGWIVTWLTFTTKLPV